ncbi:MAG: right-handed parallel beta-helix repeat-containing protein [Myxococcota bacterium]
MVRWTSDISAALLGVSLGVGCPAVDPYACLDDARCILEGGRGVCDPRENRCAYPDATCASGFRFPDVTDGGLAGMCTTASPGSTGTASETAGNGPGGSGPVESSGGNAVTSSTDGACELVESPPRSITQSVAAPIERLVIDAVGQPAITVSGVAGVHLRDLVVTFSGAPGILIEDSPGVVIERVSVVNVGVDGPGAAALGEYGIRIARSEGAVLRDITVRDAVTGIQVEDSDDLLVETFIVNNARGQASDVGGDCVLVQTSERVTVQHFGCLNDPRQGTAHAGIFIDNCVDALVYDGVVSDVEHSSGAGVRVHTQSGGRYVVVDTVDVVRGRHSCFNIVGGDEVDLRSTRCRHMPDPHTGWVNYMLIGSVRVEGGEYYDVDTLQCCDAFETFEVSDVQFSPHNPPDVAAPCAP